MDGFSNKQDINTHDFSQAGQFSTQSPELGQLVRNSKGSFFQDSNIQDALKQALGVSVENTQAASTQNASAQNASAPVLNVQTAAPPDDHDHAPAGAGNFEFHVGSLDEVAVAKTLSANNVGKTGSLKDAVGSKGDLLLPGAGNNTAIGSGDSDIIVGSGRGFNTITTGTGNDTIVLGQETTNRILDFDPSKDKFALAPGVSADNIVIAQGKNPGKGGLGQPLDSLNNTLIIDKSTNHILATMPFTKAASFSEGQFSQLNPLSIFSLAQVDFKVQAGDGKLTGSGQQHDLMIGKGGDDFLYVGDDAFKIGTAKGSGPTEFPFPTDSPGTSEMTGTLQNGVLKLAGSYKDFDASPLFSQGENVIDPKAKILNGSDPVALIEGFKKVPNDVEGNKLSGTHLHFSPSGDSRGNFADATVVRYFKETPIDAKSGTISGEFHLNSEEQAAFLAGDLYANIHSNVGSDGDGRAGFPTGENRLNFNQDVVQFV
jgi:hypothetical protein